MIIGSRPGGLDLWSLVCDESRIFIFLGGDPFPHKGRSGSILEGIEKLTLFSNPSEIYQKLRKTFKSLNISLLFHGLRGPALGQGKHARQLLATAGARKACAMEALVGGGFANIFQPVNQHATRAAPAMRIELCNGGSLLLLLCL